MPHLRSKQQVSSIWKLRSFLPTLGSTSCTRNMDCLSHSRLPGCGGSSCQQLSDCSGSVAVAAQWLRRLSGCSGSVAAAAQWLQFTAGSCELSAKCALRGHGQIGSLELPVLLSSLPFPPFLCSASCPAELCWVGFASLARCCILCDHGVKCPSLQTGSGGISGLLFLCPSARHTKNTQITFHEQMTGSDNPRWTGPVHCQLEWRHDVRCGAAKAAIVNNLW